MEHLLECAAQCHFSTLWGNGQTDVTGWRHKITVRRGVYERRRSRGGLEGTGKAKGSLGEKRGTEGKVDRLGTYPFARKKSEPHISERVRARNDDACSLANDEGAVAVECIEVGDESGRYQAVVVDQLGAGRGVDLGVGGY